MKKVESLASVTQRSVLFACVVFGIAVITLFGCGDGDNPLKATEENPVAMASLKRTEAVPAAPAAPQSGFHIKEVGYYADWRLTKPLSGTVTPGTTIFVKVVFSEPIRFRPADDASARPILYYRINTDRFRYRVAKHGAGGEDFVSGDAKPWHSGTDDYICKFVIPKDTIGRFRVEVGKLNTNRNGENLPAFYVHKEALEIAIDSQDREPIAGEPSLEIPFDLSDVDLPPKGSVPAGVEVLDTDKVFHFTAEGFAKEQQNWLGIFDTAKEATQAEPVVEFFELVKASLAGCGDGDISFLPEVYILFTSRRERQKFKQALPGGFITTVHEYPPENDKRWKNWWEISVEPLIIVDSKDAYFGVGIYPNNPCENFR